MAIASLSSLEPRWLRSSSLITVGSTLEVIIRRLELRRSPLALVLLAAIFILTVACARIAQPEGWSGPVASDDLVLGSDSGELSALEVSEDKFTFKWRFPDPDRPEEDDKDIEPEGIYGTPIVADGVVYFGAYDGFVYALDLESGRPTVWPRPFETDGPVIGGAALNEGVLFFGPMTESCTPWKRRRETSKGAAKSMTASGLHPRSRWHRIYRLPR